MYISLAPRFCLLLALAVILCTTSCTRVVFDIPPPKGAAALNAFPEDLQGAYVSEEDDFRDTMYITSQLLITPVSSEIQVSLKEVEEREDLMIKDSVILDDSYPGTEGFEYVLNDSMVTYRVSGHDTLGLSDTLIIKKYKDYYVLSLGKPGEWDVYLAKWHDQSALHTYAVGNYRPHDKPDAEGDYDGEIKDYFDIVEFERFETEDYLIRPTRKQFGQLIKRGFFRDQGALIRVK